MAQTKQQLKIPGTEANKIKEVNVAAEAYVDARDERMRKTEMEVTARDVLIEVMKKNKLSVYRDDDVSPPLIVTLAPGKDKVKVAKADDSDEGEEIEE
jgi:hypothetical protein